MIFHSLTFVIFFAIVLAFYYILAHRWQNRMLLVASYVFYGWWDVRFLSLILISTVIDFWAAQKIHQAGSWKNKKRFLALSVVTNLTILGFFKYFNFFLDNLFSVLNLVGLPVQSPVLNIILPVGISFYTFQSMSYSIDVYRGKLKPTDSFLDFGLYVSFFPQLVAGPIERAKNLLPQIQKKRRVAMEDLTAGSQLLLMGYFKKMVIADSVSPYVDEVFANPGMHASSTLILAVYLFMFQFYCDFSGYSDIARGAARLLGFDLCLNFRQPFLSVNISDFWRRWHISLSSWIRDYMFVPLGGSRKGIWATSRNTLIVMTLIGLWHGAAWPIIFACMLHGVYMVIQGVLQKSSVFQKFAGLGGRWNRAIKILINFQLLSATFLLFRIESMSQLWQYLVSFSASYTTISKVMLIHTILAGSTIFIIDWICETKNRETPFDPAWPAWSRGIAYASLLVAVTFIGEANETPFIYFQF